MRREAIQQAVAVRADFQGGVVTPVSFRHAGRERRSDPAGDQFHARAGRHPRFHFSVTVESGDVCELQLAAADLGWWLDSITLED